MKKQAKRAASKSRPGRDGGEACPPVGAVLWFTGLSGSGKSTVARALSRRLARLNRPHVVLDGDVVRRGLCADLGFSQEDRLENLRRVAEVARLFADCGMVCIVAFISPLRLARSRARRIVGPRRYYEIHFSAPLSVCEGRDCKGLYARARAGKVKQFTGLSSPYEAPRRPDAALDTSRLPVAQSVEILEAILRQGAHLDPRAAAGPA